MNWIKIGECDVCTCRECSWCKDAVMECLETFGWWVPSTWGNTVGPSGKRRLTEYLTSPIWYQREAARLYFEEMKNGTQTTD